MSTLPESIAYVNRVVDPVLTRRLKTAPAVLIEGCRACGKTTTARRFAASEVLLDHTMAGVSLPALGSFAVLEGAVPRLVDEWQIVSRIWDMVRRESDRRGAPGQFILTGSADPPPEARQHSGVGRVARILMRPMSLFESGLSNGSVSLRDLFNGVECSALAPDVELGDIAEAVCRGGWPMSQDMDAFDAGDFVADYLEELARLELTAVDGVHHDPARVSRLLVSLGRNISTEASLRTLATDTGGQQINPKTVDSYIRALQRLFISEDVPAWAPQLRSRSRLRNTPKRQLVDPSLAAAALGATRQRLLVDLKTLGFLFESLCIRDLRVYSAPMRATVSHYRDNSLEVDVIVQQSDGAWIGVEVKLGEPAAVDAAAASLLKLRDRVDTTRVGEPARLVVLTATGYAYERTDGVAVAPIAALGP